MTQPERTGTQMGEQTDAQVNVVKTPDLDRYDDVLARARAIFQERNRVRRSAFRNAGWKGNLVEVRKKLDRVWSIWQDHRDPETKDWDEVLDLINAAVFVLICMDEDRPNGNWPWP